MDDASLPTSSPRGVSCSCCTCTRISEPAPPQYTNSTAPEIKEAEAAEPQTERSTTSPSLTAPETEATDAAESQAERSTTNPTDLAAAAATAAAAPALPPGSPATQDTAPRHSWTCPFGDPDCRCATSPVLPLYRLPAEPPAPAWLFLRELTVVNLTILYGLGVWMFATEQNGTQAGFLTVLVYGWLVGMVVLKVVVD